MTGSSKGLRSTGDRKEIKIKNSKPHICKLSRFDRPPQAHRSSAMRAVARKQLNSPPSSLPNTTEMTVPAALQYVPRGRLDIFTKTVQTMY